jgi:acetyl/propionyl-CoA carboxylase alpha subunit
VRPGVVREDPDRQPRRIAVRIIRTCRRLGIGTVAVYSEADHRSPYVQLADEAVFLGPARAQDSYLDKSKVVEAALRQGCQALHPGYGFLSENADFARMVSDAGVVFVGPPASAIATLGDKLASQGARHPSGGAGGSRPPRAAG